MKHYVYSLIAGSILVAAATSCEPPATDIDAIRANFVSPPESCRPGVYWYFMDGNLSKEGITKDLEAMKESGIGYVTFLEVNAGVPRGEIDFMSDEWKECFVHAVRECERLGIVMTLGTGPGWAGSGGPWVKGEKSMQHLVSSVTDVTGGGHRSVVLPVPDPMRPFFGEEPFTPELHQRWRDYYADVAVLAFPKPDGSVTIAEVTDKALYYRSPYSSSPEVKRFMERDDSTGGAAIPVDKIYDLTGMLHGDTLTWDAPDGEWCVMRVGARNNGAVTRPAPLPGVGFECDKADTTALMAHLRAFTGELLDMVADRDRSLPGGLKFLHIDSWEMGAQNWTPHLREEFRKRRGYDPQPYYPVYAGYVVGNKTISERFLWDLRQTMQELILENHSSAVREYAYSHGMQLSIEPYDMTPMQDLELGATADVPMCEFWALGGFNTTYSAVESSSIAHLKGQRVVPAEAFTAHLDGWKRHPASMKNQTDWAFGAGINRLTYHTFQHQCLPDSLRPGMTMGPYGVHWDRNQTWWPYVGAYHTYVTRCQYMLQQGQTVADVLYLAPEEAPFVFRAPDSALVGDALIDRRGYNFDACPPSLLYTATVKDGKVTFPSGAQYRLLVLPHFKTMTTEMLAKLQSLVRDGATLVGLPPVHTPGLTGYPESDTKLRAMVADLWGTDADAAGISARTYGKGKVYSGTGLLEHEDNLYADYATTSDILANALGVAEDFTSSAGNLRYIHQHLTDTDIYFVSNRTADHVAELCTFRVSGMQPQLWDPVTGETRDLTSWTDNGTTTAIDLEFDCHQSYFVVFNGKPTSNNGTPNFHKTVESQTIAGPWHVIFDPKWGGPASVEFDTLTDWSTSANDSIRYYSGTAVYATTFDCAALPEGRIYLSLGDVQNIARVILNGQDLGIVWSEPWQIEATDAIREGSNELTVEVTNLWVNRLIGDEHLPDDGIVGDQWPQWLTDGTPRTSGRHTFTTFRHYTADSPLQPSGLLGPVTILEKR